MAEKNIAFKSFYYSLGTTSFRMQNFNQKIERQLDLLNRSGGSPNTQTRNGKATSQFNKRTTISSKKTTF